MSDYHFSREQEQEKIEVLKRTLRVIQEWARLGTQRQTQEIRQIIVEPEDATWISSLLYEECDRGLIEVNVHVTAAPQCIVMDLVVSVVAGVGADLAKRVLDKLIIKIGERLRKRLREKEKSLD